jgi:uncharacterized membrane protein YidH (DUF202 family)
MPPADPRHPAAIDPANRTRLAWTRTAVAFLAIGGAMLKSSPVAGFAVLLTSLPVWAVARRTDRTRLAASSPSGLRLVTATVVLVALVALVVAIFGHSPDSLGQLLRGR